MKKIQQCFNLNLFNKDNDKDSNENKETNKSNDKVNDDYLSKYYTKSFEQLKAEQDYCKNYEKLTGGAPPKHIDDHYFTGFNNSEVSLMCKHRYKYGGFCQRYKPFHKYISYKYD